MRIMLVLAAVLLTAPLSAQSAAPAAPSSAWRSMPMLDARLRADFAQAQAGGAPEVEVRSRLELHHWGLLGAAAGCIAGALIMGAGADDGEVAPMRFNGCILGGAVGGFLGGIYGIATGAD